MAEEPNLNEAILKVDDAHTFIGHHHILQGLSFEAKADAVTVLIGRNGAGKSTSLKSIMGHTKAASGIGGFIKAVMAVNRSVIIGSMAFKARFAEALLLKAIFKYHPRIRSDGFYFDGTTGTSQKITIEGGDLLVLREDLIMIGTTFGFVWNR